MQQDQGKPAYPALVPPGCDKIALIGSAPSSSNLGPWGDKSWAVWGCSPGAFGVVPPNRADVWFEIHRWEPPSVGDPSNPANRPWFSPEYVRFLELFEGPVIMTEEVPSVKNCYILPYDELGTEFGPYMWSSTFSYMLAMAIKLRPRAIGLWGVDMAAGSEWAAQRPACQHFLGVAASLGIQIVVPPESDLLQPAVPYGVIEQHPRYQKLLMRRSELNGQMNNCLNNAKAMAERAQLYKGCIENLDYMLATWADDVDPGLRWSDAVSHSAVIAGRPVPLVAAAHRFPESKMPPPLQLDPPLQPLDRKEWVMPLVDQVTPQEALEPSMATPEALAAVDQIMKENPGMTAIKAAAKYLARLELAKAMEAIPKPTTADATAGTREAPAIPAKRRDRRAAGRRKR